MSPRRSLRLVVALRCEAQPLIERLELLPRDSGGRLRCYAGVHHDAAIELAISGVGAIAAATAVGVLQGHGGAARARWLNVGLAGHRWRALGDTLLASRVIDARSSRSFDVQAAFASPAARVPLRTVDGIEQGYPEGDESVEMEAYGFFAAARRFANAKAVHALKVVSDNAQSPPLGRDEAKATRLITGALPLILETIDALIEQSRGAEDEH